MSRKQKKVIPILDLEAFSKKIRGETDRACAVLGGAMLDARLESLFRRRLSCHEEELLSGFGPLASFSSRTKIANALAWIDDDVFRDIEVVRGVRNEFAHSFDLDLSFENASISDRCKNLLAARSFIEGMSVGLSDNSGGLRFGSGLIESLLNTLRPPRARFELTVEFLSQYIDGIDGITNVCKNGGFLGDLVELGKSSRPKVSMHAHTSELHIATKPDGAEG